MKRGEVWLAELDGPQPVVLLGPAGHVFCTWRTHLAAEHLVARIGVLSAAKMSRLTTALRLAEDA
ncbi:hypothetical protein [Paractinoplanes maris]|uniref:hypothetical protein n=1 Tax=Paractinoplanes maris TaxID=1734446 RepID=UPI002022689D|nr:hypothetical protein [Actinoplanes maris]